MSLIYPIITTLPLFRPRHHNPPISHQTFDIRINRRSKVCDEFEQSLDDMANETSLISPGDRWGWVVIGYISIWTLRIIIRLKHFLLWLGPNELLLVMDPNHSSPIIILSVRCLCHKLPPFRPNVLVSQNGDVRLVSLATHTQPKITRRCETYLISHVI